MWRFHFTGEDLARLRFEASPGPVMESWFALNVMARRRPGALFEPWRRSVVVRESLRLLGGLAQGVHPLDVYTLAGAGAHVEEGLDSLLGVGAAPVRAELDSWGQYGDLPSWSRLLPDDAETRGHFAAAVRETHTALLGPYRDPLRAHLEAEVTARAGVMARGGAERLLSTLHPDLLWRDMTLDVTTRFTSRTLDVHLNGRGLVLIPSVFCRLPLFSYDSFRPDDAPVLFYPALRDPAHALALWGRRAAGAPQRAGTLGALLGVTRAAVLEEVGQGCTTTHLARKLAISAATASHHVAILRDSGLVISRRQGGSVLHLPTPLGLALLNGTLSGPN
ncbi:ArsR/SmtB family transcription factor [Nonomuraea sp. NPDC051191]|uniref:ArsR/SmtB family transcription factor n=1 Tax=Nonomuraea sp. NPDC051191 TaxID=3364372 RepID=UPI00379B18E2